MKKTAKVQRALTVGDPSEERYHKMLSTFVYGLLCICITSIVNVCVCVCVTWLGCTAARGRRRPVRIAILAASCNLQIRPTNTVGNTYYYIMIIMCIIMYLRAAAAAAAAGERRKLLETNKKYSNSHFSIIILLRTRHFVDQFNPRRRHARS